MVSKYSHFSFFEIKIIMSCHCYVYFHFRQKFIRHLLNNNYILRSEFKWYLNQLIFILSKITKKLRNYNTLYVREVMVLSLHYLLINDLIGIFLSNLAKQKIS